MTQSNVDSYNAIAAKWSNDRATSAPDELVLEFAELLHPNSVVLDVGCGSGKPNAAFLAERNIQVTGIDVSSQLLEAAKENVPNGTFNHTSITDYEPDQTFDGVIAWDSLFHLKLEEHELSFIKIFKLLKPGGSFVFTHGGGDGEISGEMHGYPFTYSSLGPEKTKQLLVSLGFGVIRWVLDESEDNGYLKALVQK